MKTNKERTTKDVSIAPKIFIWVIIVVILMGGFYLSAKFIKPGEVGIKVALVNIPYIQKAGVVDKIIESGFAFYVPLAQDVVVVKTKLQSYRFKKNYSGNKKYGRGELRCKSKSGIDIFVEMNVFYQIDEKYILELTKKHSLKKVSDIVGLYAGEAFSSLVSLIEVTDIHAKSAVRESMIDEAIKITNQKFKSDALDGISIEDIKIVNLYFDSEYQAKLDETSKQGTELFLQEAQLLVQKEIDKIYVSSYLPKNDELETLRKEGAIKENQIRYDGDSYYSRKVSEGEYLIKKALSKMYGALAPYVAGETGKNISDFELIRVLREAESISIPDCNKEALSVEKVTNSLIGGK